MQVADRLREVMKDNAHLRARLVEVQHQRDVAEAAQARLVRDVTRLQGQRDELRALGNSLAQRARTLDASIIPSAYTLSRQRRSLTDAVLDWERVANQALPAPERHTGEDCGYPCMKGGTCACAVVQPVDPILALQKEVMAHGDAIRTLKRWQVAAEAALKSIPEKG